jgi:Flp pilus assembly pilin Flp
MKLRSRKGQAMTEYILIIALIAILVIAGVRLFGGKIKDAFSSSGNKVEQAVNNSTT